MPFALVGLGLILIVTGVRDTYAQLGAQLTKDFTGQQNFTVWILAIGSVGALGYINELRTFSHYFLALIIVAMFLSNKGFFQKFSEQFNAGPLVTAGPTSATMPSAANGFGIFNVPQVSSTPNPEYGTYNSMDPTQKLGGWWNYLIGK